MLYRSIKLNLLEHQWQRQEHHTHQISTRNQSLDQRNPPAQESPRFGTEQMKSLKSRLWQFCWCFQGRAFHLETSCETQLSELKIFLSDEDPLVESWAFLLDWCWWSGHFLHHKVHHCNLLYKSQPRSLGHSDPLLLVRKTVNKTELDQIFMINYWGNYQN